MLNFGIRRHFSRKGQDPYDSCEWHKVPVQGIDGDVEAPKKWSANAVEVTATRYLRGERSIRDLIRRVIDGVIEAAVEQKRLTLGQAKILGDELAYMMIHQIGAFNSPVFFNLGTMENRGRPGLAQVSACFIQSVSGDYSGLMKLLETEAELFRHGSGTGSNFSTIPPKGEKFSDGVISEGLIAYLDKFDRSAQKIKSGGVARRSAKMVIIDQDHPEVTAFVRWKRDEERSVRARTSPNESAQSRWQGVASMAGQNANNSVRVTDGFMKAVVADGKSAWERPLFDEVIEAAWECADPGLQFADTIQRWNPVSELHPIRACNPCSEFLFVDDSACNLASLNLVKFLKPHFDWEEFQHAARIFLCAQEILVDWASYPTDLITLNSRNYRPLGLGYANLGGAIMQQGWPYDSEEARCFAESVTAVMHFTALEASSEWAAALSPFAHFEKHKRRVQEVMNLHYESLQTASSRAVWPEKLGKWFAEVRKKVKANGLRNAQLTLIAPTGTIGLMMDCDTLGVEPEFSLIKGKDLTEGRRLKFVNRSIEPALVALRYSDSERQKILGHLVDNGDLGSAPGLRPEHVCVFDTAMGRRSSVSGTIAPEGHLLMLAVVQRFLSGGISKTVNLEKSATPVDVRRIYVRAWELGLKSISIYRDGSKVVQPLCVEC